MWYSSIGLVCLGKRMSFTIREVLLQLPSKFDVEQLSDYN